jgi:hypothetical protein
VVRDVALHSGGRLEGRVVNADGQPTATQVVVYDQHGKEAGSATSDADGVFVVQGLRAGAYHVATSAAALPCRCWADRTAPPSAVDRVLLVQDPAVLRGQRPFHDFLFSPPVLIGVLIAAAIAIPIAVHNSQDDDAS